MKKIPIFEFKIFKQFKRDLVHGVSMREGGVSEGHFESLNLGLDINDEAYKVEENLRRFCERLKIDREHVCLSYQNHSNKILMVDEVEIETGRVICHDERYRDKKGEYRFQNLYDGVDGFLTDLSEVPLAVRFADCQGIFLFDPVRRVIGAVHCGWRGNAQNIAGKAVLMMVKEYRCNPLDIYAGISPSLGPCCSEFTDPGAELPEEMHEFIHGKNVDLWDCTIQQLYDEGVPEENIELAGICTKCENDTFFSYRGGNRKSGHMGGLIMMK